MIDNFEEKLYEIGDSTKMNGISDRLERMVNETKASIGITGARVLSEEELDLVAGGKNMVDGTTASKHYI